jgi:hypothetical protein
VAAALWQTLAEGHSSRTGIFGDLRLSCDTFLIYGEKHD